MVGNRLGFACFPQRPRRCGMRLGQPTGRTLDAKPAQPRALGRLQAAWLKRATKASTSLMPGESPVR